MKRPDRRITIIGVEIDRITIPEAIKLIVDRSGEPGASYVTKPYVEFFRHDYSDLLNRAWLRLPEGVALQWAAYYQSTSGSYWQLIKTLSHIVIRPSKLSSVFPDKFAGTNFTWPLLEAATEAGKSIYLVGSPAQNDISHTVDTLRKGIPNINIVGTMPGRDESGRFSSQLEDKLLNQLRQLRPDIVLVGIGFPRQERLILRLIEKLNHGVFIGEGGTFDYQLFGGRNKKAPRFMQKIGLEWLWRLILQPWRIKRQLAIPLFIWRVARFTKTGSRGYHEDKQDKHKRIDNRS